MAVPAAGFGSSVGWILAVVGLIFTYPPLLYLGIILFQLRRVFSR